jgi:hypothetical protein
MKKALRTLRASGKETQRAKRVYITPPDPGVRRAGVKKM